ncbi:MAG: hypothetical protein U0V48_14910 [Anaerolineales bacterium]
MVARQFRIPCVVGASAIKINLEKRQMTVGESRQRRRMGFGGRPGTKVFIGKIPTSSPSLEEQTELLTLLKWADEISARKMCAKRSPGYPTRGLQVWANARLSERRATRPLIRRGEIGLCRTEHMFFELGVLPSCRR